MVISERTARRLRAALQVLNYFSLHLLAFLAVHRPFGVYWPLFLMIPTASLVVRRDRAILRRLEADGLIERDETQGLWRFKVIS